jgi:tetratricopeptide (TPR) repeat protein
MSYKLVMSVTVLGLTVGLGCPSRLHAQEGDRTPRTYFRLAEMALANRHYDQAIQYATKTVEKKPGFFPAYAVRGMAYFFKGNDYSAIQDFCTVIVCCPTTDIYVLRGACYLKKKKYAEAIEDASQAIKLNKRCADGYFVRALAYGAQGQKKLAKADYRKWKRFRRTPGGKPR